MARTTLVIDEQRLVELKRLAAERRQTLSSLVDEFLRAGLRSAQASKSKRKRVALPSFQMGVPRANLSDRDHLFEVMEQ